MKGCTINKNLFPLKCTLFFFSAAAFAILPYLTIHMKDLGISDIDIALIYTVLPFCVFVAPPIIGYLGDKMGNYTRVLQMNVLLCGVFHTLLLFVPETTVAIKYPVATAHFVGSDVRLAWEACNSSYTSSLQKPPHIRLELSNCSLSCSVEEESACSLLAPLCTKPRPDGSILLSKLVGNVSETGNGTAEFTLKYNADKCSGLDYQGIELPHDCSMMCQVKSNAIEYCSKVEGEMRLTTNAVYFVLRVVATMALACCFIMLDAQTIQMCSVEEANGNKGAYGRQILYKTLAQAIISPLVGIIMDKITEMTGSPNYLAPFLISDVLLLATMACIYLIDKDIGLPKDTDTMKGIRGILSSVSCIVFLVMMFVCGSLYGFVETFLFVYLKEDLNAPIYLLGLTITTGALVSIPFLYYSDWIVNKFGMVNVIIWALIMYGVRYVGYSFITCAWYAFPFEALEVFTIQLLRVGSAKYVKVFAPPGTLATLTGLSGGAHFGFGKGMGGLIGGILKDQFKSTAMAFRVFGIAAFVFGLLYGIFHLLYGSKVDKKMLAELAEKEERLKMEPFIQTDKPIQKQ